MKIAWKEMKKNKVRFIILGSIIFLISFLTFIISGLASGLSQDNAALIKDMPNGKFYMNKEADHTHSLSKIDRNLQDSILSKRKDAVAFSIQMGYLNDPAGKQRSVAFVTSTESSIFVKIKDGEIVLDRSLKNIGIKIGDTLTNDQFSGKFTVKGFVDQKKYSHAPVAFISMEDYKKIYKVNEMQLIYIPSNGSFPAAPGLTSLTKKQFLQSIPSYKAEQMSLNMIVWFLIIISGMLFAIFFYMMNVQKIGLFGILKAIGVKTSTLFKMMWMQMCINTIIALSISNILSQVFKRLVPNEMPFYLPSEISVKLSVVFLLIGFIGATASGIQIKKVEPIHAIQQGEA